ncbi:MAG: UDP-2,4-diacetamido-2,4,6-trideoxy-beta-L-altropyranose hydrolase [Roseateles sp.]
MTALPVLIRADASSVMGHGHVMRCLALAAALRERGAIPVFAQVAQAGDASAAIAAADCRLLALSSVDDAQACLQVWLDAALPPPAVLVVDHYGLDARWVQAFHAGCAARGWALPVVLVIDDLANRPLLGDWLLDQNWHVDPAARYAAHWQGPAAQTLFGPGFALLRHEFAQARAALRERRAALSRVVLAFGGSDPPDATDRCIAVLREGLGDSVCIDAVIGGGNPHVATLAARWQGDAAVTLTVAATDMAARFAAADLFVGAGGSMTWERACLGLPGITLTLADNQEPLCRALADAGEGVHLGPWTGSDAQCQALLAAVRELATDSPRRLDMGRRLAARLDGRGAARVAHALWSAVLSAARA